MSGYVVEMKRTPGITAAERRRRLAQCYKFILSLTTRSSDAPGLDSEAHPGASGDDHESRRQGHDTTALLSAQVFEGC